MTPAGTTNPRKDEKMKANTKKSKTNTAAKPATVYIVEWKADGERRQRIFQNQSRAEGYLKEYRDLMLRYGDTAKVDGPRLYRATLEEVAV